MQLMVLNNNQTHTHNLSLRPKTPSSSMSLLAIHIASFDPL